MTSSQPESTPPPGPPHDTETETHQEPRRMDASHAPADERSGPVHGQTDHGDDHGHDDHGHGEAALGPVDVWAWGAGVLGLAVAVVIALVFAFSTGTL